MNVFVTSAGDASDHIWHQGAAEEVPWKDDRGATYVCQYMLVISSSYHYNHIIVKPTHVEAGAGTVVQERKNHLNVSC